MVAPADAQNWLVSAYVKFGCHFGRAAVSGAFRRLQHGLQRSGGHFGVRHGVQVQRHTVSHRAQGFGVHKVLQACDHRLGHLVLARQLGQRIARNGAAVGATGKHRGVDQRNAQQEVVQVARALQIQLLFTGLDLVERRLRNVDVTTLHQLGHLAVKEGEQQRADVRAVHVGVGHDDDAVVAQLGDVEVVIARGAPGLADAGAQGGDQGQNFVAGQELFVARFFHVQNLAAQGQNGLELAVAPLLGAAAGRVALDDVNLAHRRVFFLAVGQLAGQAHAVQHAFAPRHVARLAGGFAGAGGLDDFADDDLGVGRALLQVVGQQLAHNVFHRAAHFAADQLVLGLAAELGLGHFDRQHAGQAFAHVVAGHFHLGFFGQLRLVNVFVDHPRHGRAQAGQVGATVALGDVVGKAQHLLVVAAVPLHGHFHTDVGVLVALAVAHGVEDVGVQHRLALVDEVDETLDAPRAREVVFFAAALVFEANAHAVVQKAQFAQALAQDLVMKVVVLFEDVGVGQKVHFGAALFGVANHLHGRDFHAVLRF